LCIARHRQPRADPFLFFITRNAECLIATGAVLLREMDGRSARGKVKWIRLALNLPAVLRSRRTPTGRPVGWLAGWLSYNPRLREQYLKLSGFLFPLCPSRRPPSRAATPQRAGGAARERHSAGGRRPGDDPVASYSSYPPNNYRWDRGCHLSSFSSRRSDPPPLPSHRRSPGEPSAGTEAR